ncbi:hypothetical protein KCU83_g167, partial [Aureobasidium melanogenum]
MRRLKALAVHASQYPDVLLMARQRHDDMKPLLNTPNAEFHKRFANTYVSFRPAGNGPNHEADGLTKTIEGGRERSAFVVATILAGGSVVDGGPGSQQGRTPSGYKDHRLLFGDRYIQKAKPKKREPAWRGFSFRNWFDNRERSSEHPAIEHARLAFTDGPGFWVNYCHAPHDSWARCVCVRSKGLPSTLLLLDPAVRFRLCLCSRIHHHHHDDIVRSRHSQQFQFHY